MVGAESVMSKPLHSFLQGGGEMGERTRQFNWAESSLGTPEKWPRSLQNVVSILLNSRFPMFLFWGNELTCFYNDAYRPSLGDNGKHPFALGQPGAEVWPEIWPTIKPLIDQVMEKAIPTWSEDQLIPIFRNNRLEDVYWTFSYSPVYEGNKVCGVFVTCTETTEKVLMLNRVLESERAKSAILNGIVEHMPYALLYCEAVRDAESRISDFKTVTVNEHGAVLFGYSLDEFLEKSILHIHRERGAMDLYTQYQNLVETGEPLVLEYYMEALDRWFLISGVRLNDGFLVNYKDISERKRMSIELEHLVEELRRSNATLEEFAYAASHDMKEPIRKVHFFAERLKEKLSGRLAEDEKNMFERMEHATERMRLLVDDLLEYSHVSIIPKEREEVDLNKKFQLILTDIELVIQESGARISIGPMPVINGYRRQLQQLFQNLLLNAIKYKKPGEPPEITVSATTISGADSGLDLSPTESGKIFHLIELKDKGIGFDQSEADRIFNIFFRLHGNSEYQGTGIGLSIARKVAQNHDGFIRAISSPGEGAAFQVFFAEGVRGV